MLQAATAGDTAFEIAAPSFDGKATDDCKSLRDGVHQRGESRNPGTH